ncbi:ribonuclease M5 [Mesoplasma syrphidae]|uniref:Ribonuclease M5 n=1 Tax=Mesoplasma syrphidae TaxID=225999 RepID=A0A2K9C4I7_9MOLU|nr:ribonuclease M5 [Mesoplasma syrphidae]AUF83197.1 ribonuclease M5 [Mesoplasma syrphidae]
MNEQKIKQIIIVEGKSDTQKLKKIYGENLKTIETQGLSLSKETLEFIKKVNDEIGVIIFTDPDGPGKKIRERIINFLDGKVVNAFITKENIEFNSKKIGVAEANEVAIKKALEDLVIFDKTKESLTWKQYLDNDFYLKENRSIICKKNGWNQQISSKTLFKWLNWINLNVEDIKAILGE